MKLFISLALVFLIPPAFSQGINTPSKGQIKEQTNSEFEWLTVMTEDERRSLYLAYQPKRIELPSGVNLEYVEHGEPSGKPVIFLHGLSDSWHSFELILPHLPPSVHAFFLSLRGHGNSDRPEKGYSPADFSEDLAAFMKLKKTGPAIIVGHSMGSTIAQRFAADHTDLISGLVLIGSFADLSGNTVMLEFNKTVSGLKDPIEYGFAEEFQKSTLNLEIPATFLDTMIHESLKLPSHAWKEAMSGLIQKGYVPELKNFKKPALLCWGEKDLFVPYSDPEKLKSVLKDSKLIVYKNTGHAVHWEQPQLFAADLVGFINRTIPD